ncbi:MAG TPA: hypothetical protein VHB77_20880, partial [Planctomycetaceae bacterium]|nr:hypothetical protein [Planctomycetaceae bacterium]
MSSLKFPYLLWQDVSGQFTAALLEEDPAAVGPTRQVAVDELRAYLRWLYTQQPWRSRPDFRDPELLELRVPVRPEYAVGDRLFPCDEQITLPVHCVHGVQEGGLRIASVPVLGVRFCYYKADSLRD